MSSCIKDLLVASEITLRNAGIDDPSTDVRLLLGWALGKSVEFVFAYPEYVPTSQEVARFVQILERRAAREPLSKIIGQREFWSLTFKVTPATLDPRPDSETLIEAVLLDYPENNAPLKILDYGTGSGCLLLAALSEYHQAQGVGVDMSPEALAVARENAARLGLDGRSEFIQSNWGEAVTGKYDIILTNPPYIPEGDRSDLQAEVKHHDPETALFAGEEGLDDYRRLAPDIKKSLATEGRVYLEIGKGQGADVREIMTASGITIVASKNDLAGIERCLIGIHTPTS